jgi:hypothetical protein
VSGSRYGPDLMHTNSCLWSLPDILIEIYMAGKHNLLELKMVKKEGEEKAVRANSNG